MCYDGGSWECISRISHYVLSLGLGYSIRGSRSFLLSCLLSHVCFCKTASIICTFLLCTVWFQKLRYMSSCYYNSWTWAYLQSEIIKVA